MRTVLRAWNVREARRDYATAPLRQRNVVNSILNAEVLSLITANTR